MFELLLTKGYLPKQLPPSFNSERLSEIVRKTSLQMKVLIAGLEEAKLCTHFLARANRTPHILSIMGPAEYIILAKIIAEHWKTISGILAQSMLSQSTPVADPLGLRCIHPKLKREALQHIRREVTRPGISYIKADIQKYYYSLDNQQAVDTLIQALHDAGHNIAKSVHEGFKKLYESRQESVGLGIPVGPDTSLILSEFIQVAVDTSIQQKRDYFWGYRYIDDFEFACSSEQISKELLNLLTSKLQNFGLCMNSSKTSICDELLTNEPQWKYELAKFRETFKGEFGELKFNRFKRFLINLSEKYPEMHAGKFGFQAFLHNKCWPSSKIVSEFEMFIYRIIRLRPQGLPLGFYLMLRYFGLNDRINRDKLIQCIEDHICEHALENNSNEVAWALWGAMAFGLRLSERVSYLVSMFQDTFVGILAMDCCLRGILELSVGWPQWISDKLEPKEYTRHWLLIYEATQRGWLSGRPVNWLYSQRFLNFLREKNVSFYSGISNNPFRDLSRIIKVWM
jgi:hypothetical protein